MGMIKFMGDFDRLFAELKQRRMFQVAFAYLVVGWLAIQVADATFDNLGLPDNAERWLLYGVIAGFPLVLLAAWMIDFGRKKGVLVPGGERQEVQFCQAADGTRLAWSVVGKGPPLIKTANWLNHLEHDWESPVWSHLLRALARRYRLVRYDARGNGLSDWSPDEISFDGFVLDLEAVTDAVGWQRFPLLGISQGCAVSIAYAVRHPERVSHLVLYGGFAAGIRIWGSQADLERRDAQLTLMRQGWGQNNPAFRQIFTSIMIPGASKEQMDAFNELQRLSASPENAVTIRNVIDHLDVRHLLSKVRVPTLVLHARGDESVPLEQGRKMAAGIPGAKFVVLESHNHLFQANEPAFPRFMEEVKKFLSP